VVDAVLVDLGMGCEHVKHAVCVCVCVCVCSRESVCICMQWYVYEGGRIIRLLPCAHPLSHTHTLTPTAYQIPIFMYEYLADATTLHHTTPHYTTLHHTTLHHTTLHSPVQIAFVAVPAPLVVVPPVALQPFPQSRVLGEPLVWNHAAGVIEVDCLQAPDDFQH
jgi:hypothetical protein